MYDKPKLLLAFLLSPLTLPLLWSALATYWGVSYGEIQMGVVFIFVPAAYVAAAVFGVPLFLLCRAVGWSSLFFYLSGGVIMGLATGVALEFLDGGEVDATTLVLCSAAGALSGLVCWLIIHRLLAAGQAAS